jgi:hypothetical protein
VCVWVCVCVWVWVCGLCVWVVCVGVCVCVWVYVGVCGCVCVWVCVGVCVWGCFFIIIILQHAPLHGNTTCFTVKYSHYGYIYLQFMYNFLFSIHTVSLISVFLCIAYCFYSSIYDSVPCAAT